MAGDFDQRSTKSRWLFPAIVASLTTLVLVLIAANLAVWLWRRDRVGPEVTSRVSAVADDRQDDRRAAPVPPTGTARSAAAESLVKQARQQPEAAQRYVLFDQARTLASDAGDLRLCLSIINEMAQASCFPA